MRYSMHGYKIVISASDWNRIKVAEHIAIKSIIEAEDRSCLTESDPKIFLGLSLAFLMKA